MKAGNAIDSPLVIRKFMDHDNGYQGLLGTLSKNLQKSDFKLNPISHCEGEWALEHQAYNINERCFKVEEPMENISSLSGSNQKDISIVKMPSNGSLSFKLNIGGASGQHIAPPMPYLPHQIQLDPHMYYKLHAQEMNDDSYSSDCNDDDMDSEPLTHRQQDNTMRQHHKKSSTKVDHETGNMERIIRKRKRKSTDQLKILMREFDRNPNWSKETLLEVAKKTGLSEA